MTVKSALGPEKDAGWVLIQKALAQVRFGSSAERREAGTEGAIQVATFRVPWSSALAGVVARDRIAGAGGNWDITGFVPIGGEAGEIEFTAVQAKG